EAIGGRSALDPYLASRGTTPGEIGVDDGDGYGTAVQGVANPQTGAKELDRFYTLVGEGGTPVGVYGVRDIGPFLDHGAVGLFSGAPATTHMHFAYGLGGISTQQFARDLFRAGYSGSLFTMTGRMSDFLIEFVYGPYGGGLAVGLNASRADFYGDRTPGSP
ncbi:MAG TPA: hypothetical protein VFT43_09875, partial [Candidatus Polarisedimenticolia bacterium]|nr:hypothetical protein [Candidatus Polarisedimenticolia bacterium]